MDQSIEDPLPESRDSRSPRARSPRKSERRKESARLRSQSQSSRRSASPKSSAMSRVSSVNGETEDASARRQYNKSSGRRLNTWDVPEFLPGALPRANAVQRAFFEERSKKVFESNLVMDQIDAEASKERREREDADRLESDMDSLRQMFPTLDIELIQEFYLSQGNLDAAVQELLILSEGTDEGRQYSRIVPPSSEDEREFPPLTSNYNNKVIEINIEEYDIPDVKSSQVVPHSNHS